MNEEENQLIKIRIIDVNSIRELTKLKMFEHRKNKDSTEFYTYKFKDIKNKVVLFINMITLTIK